MWAEAAPRFHAGAWLLWLAAAMLAALSTRNPLYLALIIAISIAVNARLERDDRSGLTPGPDGSEDGPAPASFADHGRKSPWLSNTKLNSTGQGRTRVDVVRAGMKLEARLERFTLDNERALG